VLPKGDPESQSIRGTGEDRSADQARAGESRESSSPRPSWPAPSLAGLTILVVDDDEASRDYFATALGLAGAVVLTAATALDALRVVQQQLPDVVLSDVAMPGQDGYWLVREIQTVAAAAAREVPVVATTAFGRTHSRQRALSAGFVDHLPKPVEPDVLCAAIARAAGRSA
jgi:CheY-like chemotaxis protein